MLKGRKIRIYPTKEQEQKMWQHIGACRFIWNWMIDFQRKNYKSGGKYQSSFSMINLLKPLKNDNEHGWLYDVSNISLQNVCKDLNEAYQKFFKKQNGYPKYKSRKRSKASYPIRSDRMYFDGTYCQVERIGKVKYKTDYDLPLGRGNGRFCNARISFDGFKWFLSFSTECESQAPTLTDKPMGIDLGVKDLAIVACGGEHQVYHNINKSRKIKRLERIIKHKQRSVSRKYEANKVGTAYHKTNNIIREELKIKRLRKRQLDIRHNYIHQVTHELVSVLPRTVVMEDLNISGMMKNKHLSKAVQEQCLYEFIRKMKYKCEWNGIEFIQVDRFYPSSKTCSNCGTIKKDLKLSDRTFVCQDCGFTIDRDYNAALNLMRYAA